MNGVMEMDVDMNMNMMDDGGERARELMGSLKEIKMKLYDTEMELRIVESEDTNKNALGMTARYFAASLNMNDSMDISNLDLDGHNEVSSYRQSGESTYSDDKFESDEDNDVMQEEDLMSQSDLSAIGKSMVQMGLGDSMDGDALRMSFEMVGASSQLVHMTATPNGVMNMGSSPVHRNRRK